MDKYNFHWDSDTIDYYVEYEDANGWGSTAYIIYKYVADECEYDGESVFRKLYLD